MGQQQLLLLVLSVIIVGIAVVVGINMFSTSAESANVEAVTNDLIHLASLAQQYYIKPTSMAGGGNSFVGIGIRKLVPSLADGATEYANENGTYTCGVGAAAQVVLTGVPKRGSNTVTVTVTPNDVVTAITAAEAEE
jgi:Tfp pilus assembly protein PilE